MNVSRLPHPAVLALLFALLSLGCRPGGPRPPPPGPGTGGGAGEPVVRADGDFAPRIPSPSAWGALAASPGSAALAGTEVVKVVYDRSDGSMYFLQSKRWPIHYYFAARFLSRPGARVGDEATFNRVEYHRADRRFLLGSVSHYPGDVWAFELYAGDDLDLTTTADFFQRLRPLVYFGDRLKYRPVPPAHERDARTRTLMPVVESSTLFGNVRYQPLELGEAVGYVRVVRAGARFDPTSLRPFDLVVLASLPEDIPVVAGVISDEIQAPLGHINVLCHNRRTPNMALRGASTTAAITALEGKLARLVVEGQRYRLLPATRAEADENWAAKRPRETQRPPRDDRDIGLPLLSELGLDDIPRVGAKTAQLGLVTRLSRGRFAVPRGFALPMRAYSRFLAVNGLDRRIEAMLADPAFRDDVAVRRAALDALRAEFVRGAVPDDVLTALVARIRQVIPAGSKVRLRSSTNAEDLPGFNGAGLYRSTRVDPNLPGDVARGLREVWASVWLWGAFEEREFYRIDAHTVGMAVLVQESVDDDVANGVALTENPFNQGQPGFFINAQQTGGSVTGAHGDEVPEQLIAFNYEDGRGVERISNSSRTGGKPLLAPGEIARLVDALDVLHKGFVGDDAQMSGRALDVEFLIAGPDRHVVIVQARPFTVRWEGDRRYLDGQGRVLGPH